MSSYRCMLRPTWIFISSGYGQTRFWNPHNYGHMSAHKNFNPKLKIRSQLSIAICILGGRGCIIKIKILVKRTIYGTLGTKGLKVYLVYFYISLLYKSKYIRVKSIYGFCRTQTKFTSSPCTTPSDTPASSCPRAAFALKRKLKRRNKLYLQRLSWDLMARLH